jgi:trehalose 6-phosphate phosphatase
MTRPNVMESLSEIGRRIDQAGRILLALDFDGTLTPIRPYPGDAVLAESVRTLLEKLSRLPHVDVMIASGRSIADARSLVGLPGVIYSGNHGLEISGKGLTFDEPAARAATGRLENLARTIQERFANEPGVLVENKGPTASVHYRNAPAERWDHIAAVVRDTVSSQADLFVVLPGRRVWEIRPRVYWHKGSAVNWVASRLEDPDHRLVFFIGDDRTDEDAFASLPEGVTIKVGHEGPTQARYQLADPAAVELFLVWLLEKLSSRKASS